MQRIPAIFLSPEKVKVFSPFPHARCSSSLRSCPAPVRCSDLVNLVLFTFAAGRFLSLPKLGFSSSSFWLSVSRALSHAKRMVLSVPCSRNFFNEEGRAQPTPTHGVLEILECHSAGVSLLSESHNQLANEEYHVSGEHFEPRKKRPRVALHFPSDCDSRRCISK